MPNHDKNVKELFPNYPFYCTKSCFAEESCYEYGMREYFEYHKTLCKACKKIFCTLVVKYFPIEAFLLICSTVGTFVVQIHENPEEILIAFKLALITLCATFLVILVGLVLASIAISPFKIWKKDAENSKNINSSQNNLQIGFYSKQIGYLFNDLIKNWAENGVESRQSMAWFHTPHRAYTAYLNLTELSTSLLIEKNIREKIINFLNFFAIEHVFALQHHTRIYTKIKSKKSINKKLNEIENLAKTLSEDLNHVAKPKKEE